MLRKEIINHFQTQPIYLSIFYLSSCLCSFLGAWMSEKKGWLDEREREKQREEREEKIKIELGVEENILLAR